MEKKGLSEWIQLLKEGAGRRLHSFRLWFGKRWLVWASVGLMLVAAGGGFFYLATDWTRPARPGAGSDFYWSESPVAVEPEETIPLEIPSAQEATIAEPEPQQQEVTPIQPVAQPEPAAADPGPLPEETLLPTMTSSQAFADLVNPVTAEIALPFGWQKHPVYNDWRYHPGVNFKVALGTEVKAVLPGTVTAIKEDNEWGKMLIIDHGAEQCSIYGYLDETRVEPGHAVEQHQVIATVGKSGIACEPQLHLELRLAGTALDPELYLPTFGEAMPVQAQE